MIGYMDESGAPGIAKTTNDFLVVSLVIFENHDTAEKCSVSIDRLRSRLKLPESYEFHFSRNSNRVRNAFIELITNFDFHTITVALLKNDFKRTASYARMAEYIVREIVQRCPEISITIDSNPILQKELNREFKDCGSRISVRALRSRSSNLIQLADYIVALSTRRLKGREKAVKQYRHFIKKQLHFGEFRE